MRLALTTSVIAAALVGGAASTAAAATAPPPTAKVVVRPVTSTGRVAPGFTPISEPTGSVDCSFGEPSPAAVSHGIDFCSPSAEYAVACWNSAAPHRVVCLRDPLSRNVYRIPRVGAFKAAPLPPATETAPLLMRLGDGDFCQLRDGGAVGSLTGYPTLVVTYFCVRDGAVWAKLSSAHLGINESQPSWTVHTAQPGNHPLVIRHVVKAWFVGTFAA